MDVLRAGSPEPDESFRYAEHGDGVVDVHLPPGADGPVLLLLHGGFWKQAYDRLHTRPMAAALAELGFIVATPEYRRVGGGGGWPTTGEDVRAALDATLDHFDTEAVAVTGHSAGGHLALWLAATAPDLTVGAVGLAPVCDLDAAARLGLGGNATQALLGDVDPASADPMTLLSDRPGIQIVHGTRDVPVPISLSRGFVERHPYVGLIEIDADHFELIDPSSEAFASVATALTKLN